MVAIVCMGLSLAVPRKQWKVVMKLDQEAELLFRGNRIKSALETYASDYQVMKASRSNEYPVSLSFKLKRLLPARVPRGSIPRIPSILNPLLSTGTGCAPAEKPSEDGTAKRDPSIVAQSALP